MLSYARVPTSTRTRWRRPVGSPWCCPPLVEEKEPVHVASSTSGTSPRTWAARVVPGALPLSYSPWGWVESNHRSCVVRSGRRRRPTTQGPVPAHRRCGVQLCWVGTHENRVAPDRDGLGRVLPRERRRNRRRRIVRRSSAGSCCRELGGAWSGVVPADLNRLAPTGLPEGTRAVASAAGARRPAGRRIERTSTRHASCLQESLSGGRRISESAGSPPSPSTTRPAGNGVARRGRRSG